MAQPLDVRPTSGPAPARAPQPAAVPSLTTSVAPPAPPLRRVGSYRLERPEGVEAVVVGTGTGAALASTLLGAERRPFRPARAAAIPAIGTVHRVDTATEAGYLLSALPESTIVVVADPAAAAPTALPPRTPVFAAHEVIESTLGRSFADLTPATAWERSAWPARPAKRVVDTVAAVALLVVLSPLVLALAVAVAIRAGGRWPAQRRTSAGSTTRDDLLRWRRPLPVAGDAAGAPSLAERLNAGRLGQLPALFDVVTGRASLVGPATLAEAGIRVRPGVLGWDLAAGRGQGDRRPIQETFDRYYLRHASPRHDLLVVGAWASGLPGAVRDLFASPASDVPAAVTNHDEPADAAADRPAAPRLARTLVAGAGSAGQFLAVALPRRTEIGLAPVAFVDDQAALIGRSIDGLPVLGTSSDIAELVAAHDIEVVVIAMPSAKPEDLARVVAHARDSSARVLTMPDIGTLLRAESTPMELRRVDLHEVLGRPPVEAFAGLCQEFVAGKRVMVTGAAGSIGQEITRQLARLGPDAVIALDINETGLFDLNQELVLAGNDTPFHVVVASVTNTKRLDSIFAAYRPDIVFHAAAYKHVPMMEKYPQEAVFVNAIGSRRVAEAAARGGVQRFVLVSTDKAVRPSSVMGATKRTAELAIKAVARETGMSACAVRFGNVLGSRGSVIPTFERQIDAGGPVTVTDPNMRRFFMTIPEAASLTIQAGAFGDREAVYMLDMGEEVAILDLARRMIELRGLVPGRDIEIVFSGLRPGEKLREELSLAAEVSVPTAHDKIAILQEPERSDDVLRQFLASLDRLGDLALTEDVSALRAELFRVIARADRALLAAPAAGTLAEGAPIGVSAVLAADLAAQGQVPIGQTAQGPATLVSRASESGEDVDPIALVVAADSAPHAEPVVMRQRSMRSAG
jgi:FlaA1/EpsC-like NDP-sugar epimerase